MNAAKLDIVWKQTEGIDVFTMPLSAQPLTNEGTGHAEYSRRITSTASALRCPNCNSIIYSRRSGRCGVCADLLPSKLLFTTAERERIERLLFSERIRHRIWMQGDAE